jgi:hypothetical protein
MMINAICLSSLVPANKHAFTHVRLIAGGAMHVYLNLFLNIYLKNVQKPTCLTGMAACSFSL